MATAKLVLLVALAATSFGAGAWDLRADVSAPVIHALRPLVSSTGDLGVHAGMPCDSWRLAVEANNKRDWATVPASCEGYVGNYMLGGHYRRDSRAVVDEAVAYAEGLKLGGNGKEVWVFDIDETSLSNLPYYAKHGFGYVTYIYTIIRCCSRLFVYTILPLHTYTTRTMMCMRLCQNLGMCHIYGSTS